MFLTIFLIFVILILISAGDLSFLYIYTDKDSGEGYCREFGVKGGKLCCGEKKPYKGEA
jgi:hypothetical protein